MVLGDFAVHGAAALVRQLFPYGSFEESLAALAANGPIVAARRPIAAHQTQFHAHYTVSTGIRCARTAAVHQHRLVILHFDLIETQ